MGLESIIIPFKWADEQVLRQYTQLTNRWGDAGKSRYNLAESFFLGGVMAFGAGIVAVLTMEGKSMIESISAPPPPSSLKEGIEVGVYWGSLAMGIQDCVYTKILKRNEDSEGISDAIAESRFCHYSRKIQRGVRLPILGLGGFMLSLAGVCAADGQIAGACVIGGMSGYLLGLASSMYIKDSDPGILEKQKLREIAYEWACKKSEKLCPKPEPISYSQHLLKHPIMIPQ